MSFFSLGVFFVLIFVVAASGAVFSPGSWYERLEKPSWNPPKWAFPVVWMVLYIMIAVAGWIVWESGAAGASLALGFWAAQAIFNGAWSWLFFGIRRMNLALVDAGLMWVTIVGFIWAAWPISETAALLFVPYLAWVTVAFALNLTIIRMNPDAALAG